MKCLRHQVLLFNRCYLSEDETNEVWQKHQKSSQYNHLKGQLRTLFDHPKILTVKAIQIVTKYFQRALVYFSGPELYYILPNIGNF